MSFYLYHHHRLDRLAELLAVLLERNKPANPLTSQTVVVPNQGIARWLQVELAEDAGIAANYEMPMPARYLWEVIPQTLGGDAGSTHFERQQVRWHLFHLLPSLAEHLPAIEQYLNTGDRELQRYQLAERLADLFDQYMVFRPDMLRAWERGNRGDNETAHWQSETWRKLVRHLAPYRHRADLLREFVQTLSTQPRQQTEAAIFCFGPGNLPPEFLRFFYALAHRRDVHFLLLNPCGEYWGDLQARSVPIMQASPDDALEQNLSTQHPLLASLGRPTRDLLRLLYSDELKQIIEPDLGSALAYVPPRAQHLLARVQTDVIAMQAGATTAPLSANDVSIQLHACHGPLREVQVLHDQLLDLLSNTPRLRPRDIVVMMPDVQRYSAAIHAVFGAAKGDLHIPWTLSDQSLARSHPILNCFLKLLDLPLSRWRLSDVMELARVPSIMRRFELDESALDKLQDSLHQAGVRWGLDNTTRERFESGQSELHTWRFALDRMLLGLIQNSNETLFDGVHAWTQLEGQAALPLGQMIKLLDSLIAASELLSESVSARHWYERINQLLDELFLLDGDDAAEQQAMSELRSSLACLETADRCLAQDSPLSWSCLRKLMRDELGRSAQRQPFMSGGVSFCGMLPLRAVPFKVVCLLGMDDGAFPRQDDTQALNLLRQQPRLGDLQLRDEDRLLFLQSMMAATDVFYISYTGQDAGSGDTQPPAPIVSEFLDFLYRYYGADMNRAAFEHQLIARQPLQAFSPRLFSHQPTHPRLFTFQTAWRLPPPETKSLAFHWLDSATAEADGPTLIELTALQQFFRHPQRYFQQQCLGIQRIDPLEDMRSEEDPIELDALQSHQLKQQILARHQQSEVPLTPDNWWVASGLLPPPPLDQAAWAQAQEPVQALLPTWQQWQHEPQRPDGLEIALEIDDMELRGRLHRIWSDGPRSLHFGPLRFRHKLQATISACCALLQSALNDARLLSLDEHLQAQQWRFIAEREQAQDALATLVGMFRRGCQGQIHFHPDLISELDRHSQRGQSPDEALSRLNSRLNQSQSPHHLRADVWFSAMLTADQDLGDDAANNLFYQQCSQLSELVHSCWELMP